MHLHMHDEPNDAKHALFRRLHQRAGERVREDVRRLAVGQFRKQTEPAHSLLTSTLELLIGVSDCALDRMLCDRLATGRITRISLRDVAQFVLRRCPEDATAVILPIVHETSDVESGSDVCELVAALFYEQSTACWGAIHDFLSRNRLSAPNLLAQFASGRRLWPRREAASVLSDAGPDLIGQLADLLFEFYPPDSDPEYDGAHHVSQADEARRLRDQLLNWLSEPEDEEEPGRAQQRIEALRQLESKYGARFAWLRRPRARAERELRLRQRKAIPVATIADVLFSADKRLIRHDTDALDGVLAALESLERDARHVSPAVLNRYWKTPSGAAPSPKEEEFVSDEICPAIRDYFRSFAVVADREVQLYRRTIPRADGGKPGSEVDVLVSVPSAGVVQDCPIVMPIEVKRSCNAEAVDAMKNQLADRYMHDAGTAIGAYVVAWFDAPNLASNHRPKWPSITEAQADLRQQAQQLRESENLDIRVAVIDLSLQ
jgi:hypothetical protein